jgi:hypothetical protein
MRPHLLAAGLIILWFALLAGALASQTFAAILGLCFGVGLVGGVIALVYLMLLSVFRGSHYG